MSSDSDSTSSSTSAIEKNRKLKRSKSDKKSKKHKKDKKKKSRKEKKRERKEMSVCQQLDVKPIAPPRSIATTETSNNFFGAALPPHLVQSYDTTEEKIERSGLVIGPTMPKDIEKFEEQKSDDDSNTLDPPQSANISQTEKEDNKDFYGPVPTEIEGEMTLAQIELEKRALELKMAAIDGTSADKNEQQIREEWMLELPEVGLKSGLAALNNMKRGFYQGKDKPDFSDRSSWTKTPQTDDAKPGPSKTSREDLATHAHALYEKERDAQQEALAKKHKKKHKRDESLVEMHQKKLRKEEKLKAKELKEKGLKPERRPFSRDIDLKLNKIDSNQTKQIVDKAKILNTKFSSGRAKYL